MDEPTNSSNPDGQTNPAFQLNEFGNDPPSYEEVVNSTRYPVIRSATQIQGGNGNRWKLDFVDFTPHLQGNNARQASDFRALLHRANTWLTTNRDIDVLSCETVTWTSTTSSEVNDTDVVHRTRSMSPQLKTKYLRGLRLWLIPRPYDGPSCMLAMEEFVPKKQGESIGDLLKQVNDFLKNKPISGKIMNLETICVRCKPGKIYMSSTYWTESATVTKKYATCFRLYYSITNTLNSIEIGIKDFTPRQTSSNSNESFTEISDRAWTWVMEQTDIHIINVQGVFMKKKGNSPSSNPVCFYTEHTTQPDHKATYFYQVMRVVYRRDTREVPLIVTLPLRITKKTFSPTLLPCAEENWEYKFETFTKTVQRVSSWLDNTRAEVLAVESVPVRMYTGGQQGIGPDASLIWNQFEPDFRVEDWLIHVRIYLKGDFIEPRSQNISYPPLPPPVDWNHRRQQSMQLRRSSGRMKNCFVFCIVFLLIVIMIFVTMYVAYGYLT